MKSCPHCNSKNIRKRGIRSGNQKHSCNECGKYFTTPLEVNADIADGYLVKGQSKLYDADGNVKLTWKRQTATKNSNSI